METFAWVVALGFLYIFAIAPELKKWEGKLSSANERLTALASQVSEMQSGEERSLRRLHNKHDALIEALARIDDTKEVAHLKTHYALILQLTTLRDRGTPEEAIVEKHMDFRPIDGFGGSQGWRIPIYDEKRTGWTLWRFSPYYVATNNAVRIHKLNDLLEQACAHVKPGGAAGVLAALTVSTRQFDKEQFPDAEELDATVYYRDSSGKDREWPESTPEAKA